MMFRSSVSAILFLSTPSARRATLLFSLLLSVPLYFYPRPPRGGRRVPDEVGERPLLISIHALREEGDVSSRDSPRTSKISIHALREEGDVFSFTGNHNNIISIHALREEGDVSLPTISAWLTNFYPRPPRGGRPIACKSSIGASKFLSTPSARRATDHRLFL